MILFKNLKAPELVFTGFHLSDKILIPGDDGPLQEDLNEQKEIQLQYNQNVFSFELAIADYADPALNRLSYFLENFDVNWRSANSDRRAYYFNVPPGKYTFRVKRRKQLRLLGRKIHRHHYHAPVVEDLDRLHHLWPFCLLH